MLPSPCAPRRAPRHRSTTTFVAALVLALGGPAALSGCRRSAPAAPAIEPPLGELQVLKDGRFLFTYVEPSGTFATTDKPDIIPASSVMWLYYLESLTPNQRFTDDKGAGVGFTNLVYQSNVPVIYDDQCPASHMYMLNGSVTVH